MARSWRASARSIEDGFPYVTPVWQEWDGAAIWIIPRAKSAFVQHLEARIRAARSPAPVTAAPTRAYCFAAREQSSPALNLMRGEWLEMARRMAKRYLGERGPEYLEPSRSRPRYWVKVTPEATLSPGRAWSGRPITLKRSDPRDRQPSLILRGSSNDRQAALYQTTRDLNYRE